MSIQSAWAVSHPFLLLMQYLSALTLLLMISARSVFTPRSSPQLSRFSAQLAPRAQQAQLVFSGSVCVPYSHCASSLFLWMLYFFCNYLCFYVMGQQWWNKKWQPTSSVVMTLSFQFSNGASTNWRQLFGHTKWLQHKGRTDLWAQDMALSFKAQGMI